MRTGAVWSGRDLHRPLAAAALRRRLPGAVGGVRRSSATSSRSCCPSRRAIFEQLREQPRHDPRGGVGHRAATRWSGSRSGSRRGCSSRCWRRGCGRWRRCSTPLAAAAAAIPIVALTPILNTMFSSTSSTPRRLIVMIYVFFPIFVNTLKGLRQIEPVHAELMRSYAASPWTTTRVVRLPGALPFFFTGLKIASSGAVIAAIVSEYFGGLQEGLGPGDHLGRGRVRLPARVGARRRGDRARAGVLPRRGARRAPRDALATTTRRADVRLEPTCLCGRARRGRAGAGGVRRRRRGGLGRAAVVRGRRAGADAGEAAAAVVHAGPVRRLLRRRGAGLLRGRRARRRDPRGRHRHRAADPARAGPRRLRDRLGAEGAAVARAGRRHHRRRPGLPALRARSRSRSRTRTSPPPRTSTARRSATGASATSSSCSPA